MLPPPGVRWVVEGARWGAAAGLALDSRTSGARGRGGGGRNIKPLGTGMKYLVEGGRICDAPSPRRAVGGRGRPLGGGGRALWLGGPDQVPGPKVAPGRRGGGRTAPPQRGGRTLRARPPGAAPPGWARIGWRQGGLAGSLSGRPPGGSRPGLSCNDARPGEARGFACGARPGARSRGAGGIPGKGGRGGPREAARADACRCVRFCFVHMF